MQTKMNANAMPCVAGSCLSEVCTTHAIQNTTARTKRGLNTQHIDSYSSYCCNTNSLCPPSSLVINRPCLHLNA